MTRLFLALCMPDARPVLSLDNFTELQLQGFATANVSSEQEDNKAAELAQPPPATSLTATPLSATLPSRGVGRFIMFCCFDVNNLACIFS